MKTPFETLSKKAEKGKLQLSDSDKQQLQQEIAVIDQRMSEIRTIRQTADQWNKLDENQMEALLNEFISLKKDKEKKQRTLEGKIGGTMITAETKEGKTIEFNLEEIKTYWIEFYRQNNLTGLAEEIENIDINLTDEQIEKIKEKAKEGFDKLILLPKTEIQKQQLQKIKEQTEKPMKGLKDKQQYLEKPDSSGQKGIWLSDTVKPNFPDKIQTNNRPENKAYLLFLKDNPQIDQETANKSPEKLREEFKQKNETGLTIEEYLISQRDYIQRHINDDQPHADDYRGPGKVTWLLDSELDEQSNEPGQVLYAGWNPDNRRVKVYSHPASDSNSDIGARSSAIFEIL